MADRPEAAVADAGNLALLESWSHWLRRGLIGGWPQERAEVVYGAFCAAWEARPPAMSADPPQRLTWRPTIRRSYEGTPELGEAGGIVLFTIDFRNGGYELRSRLPGVLASKPWPGKDPGRLKATAEGLLDQWLVKVSGATGR